MQGSTTLRVSTEPFPCTPEDTCAQCRFPLGWGLRAAFWRNCGPAHSYHIECAPAHVCLHNQGWNHVVHSDDQQARQEALLSGSELFPIQSDATSMYQITVAVVQSIQSNAFLSCGSFKHEAVAYAPSMVLLSLMHSHEKLDVLAPTVPSVRAPQTGQTGQTQLDYVSVFCSHGVFNFHLRFSRFQLQVFASFVNYTTTIKCSCSSR